MPERYWGGDGRKVARMGDGMKPRVTAESNLGQAVMCVLISADTFPKFYVPQRLQVCHTGVRAERLLGEDKLRAHRPLFFWILETRKREGVCFVEEELRLRPELFSASAPDVCTQRPEVLSLRSLLLLVHHSPRPDVELRAHYRSFTLNSHATMTQDN